MVRDAYSAGGQQADGGTAAQPLDVRGNGANLTQELALLLAQSIAQGQVGRRPTAATGSELASLAALVSASQSQHPQPYKDGLSSLSYARPAQSPVVPAPAPSALMVSEPHDDEPMPIPSTWRQPTMGDDDRWYRQQVGAAALGLVAGLIVVVPAVLWLSGYLGGPQKDVARPPAETPPPVKVVTKIETIKVNTVTASADFTGSANLPDEVRPPKAPPPAVVESPPLASPPKAEAASSGADHLLAQAKHRISSGDIDGARKLLLAVETVKSAPVAFMLAETYDPNMLASWQTRGVQANPERARALYQKALSLGDERAQQRLDWLTVK